MRGCDLRLQFGPPIRYSVRIRVLGSGTVLALPVLLAPEAAPEHSVVRYPPVRLTKRSGLEGGEGSADGLEEVGRMAALVDSDQWLKAMSFRNGGFRLGLRWPTFFP